MGIMTGEGGAAPSQGVAKLRQALAGYRPSSDLRSETIALAHFRDLVELALARLSAQLAESQLWEEEGFLSPVAWLRQEAKLASGVAAERVAVGSRLEQVPHSLQALEQGQIGFAHLALLVRTAEFCEPGRFGERPLLEKARTQSVSRFRKTCEHARHALDPAAFGAEEAERHQARFLELSPQDDGALWLRGWLDPESGSLLRSALEPLARPCGRADARRRPQRLADALVEALTKEHRTELVVSCSLETLEGRPGAPAAETEWGGLLSGQALGRLACGASFRRLLLKGGSVVLDLGRQQRLLSPQARRALEARDRHCVWPGCERPGRWCQAHHRTEWSGGGRTAVEDSALLCGRHHRLHHEAGWVLCHSEGAWSALPPPPPVWRGDLPGG